MNDLNINMDFVDEVVYSSVSNIDNFVEVELLHSIIFLETEDISGLETATTFI